MEHISGYLKEKKVAENSQHGFALGILPVTNPIVFYYRIAQSVDEGKAVDIIYLDISKAFSIASNSMPTSRMGCCSQDGEKKPVWAVRLQEFNRSCSAWRPVISRIPRGLPGDLPCLIL